MLNLLSFWRGQDFLRVVLQEFEQMLTDAESMFAGVMHRLRGRQADPQLKDRIYRVDRRINQLEKDIRRRIIAHLSIRPESDVPACLVMMSVVKDAERLGDYAKNLYEVTELLGHPVPDAQFQQHFGDMDAQILRLFAQTRRAFVESDEAIARTLMDTERQVSRRCEQTVRELAASDLPVRTAVGLAVAARFCKRTAAHLTNIGSSVIVPITDLDFFDEDYRESRQV